jgi:protease II
MFDYKANVMSHASDDHQWSVKWPRQLSSPSIQLIFIWFLSSIGRGQLSIDIDYMEFLLIQLKKIKTNMYTQIKKRISKYVKDCLKNKHMVYKYKIRNKQRNAEFWYRKWRDEKKEILLSSDVNQTASDKTRVDQFSCVRQGNK